MQDPLSSGSDFLSGRVSGRDDRFRVQYRLGWAGATRILRGRPRMIRGKSRTPLPLSDLVTLLLLVGCGLVCSKADNQCLQLGK